MQIIKSAVLAVAVLVAASVGAMSQTVHKVAIQVSENNPTTMNLALNNVQNVIGEFKKRGEKVEIAVVAYGNGLHMLRDDTSPVKARIATISLENPNVRFNACGNTQANQSKAENKEVKLVSESKVVPSGVITLIELQKQGYAYIRP